MEPIHTRILSDDLPESYLDALENASDCVNLAACVTKVRVETYRTSDVRNFVQNVWRWPCALEDITNKSDRNRVRAIMELIPKEGVWPYVSHWADDLEELAERDEDADSPMNHGDGWHRIIAQCELQLPTIEFLYPIG